MNPSDLPIARELFAQWQRARGSRTEPASRAFRRGWEDLLDEAELTTATERDEAVRDALALEQDGWITLKRVQYKPHLIWSVALPLDMEMRWCAVFGFAVPTEAESRKFRDYDWEAPLAFLKVGPVNLPFEELVRLNDFLKEHPASRERVPIKERSLQIFGEEKRLDELLGSALFREGRLQLGSHLYCETIGVPLAWKRGPVGAADQPVIVLENAATWHSYARWNALRGHFSAVVYGDGRRFVDGVRYLADIFQELGGVRRVWYFGDLDLAGVWIPQEAGRNLIRWRMGVGGPAIEPHLWSYRKLLEWGKPAGIATSLKEGEPVSLTVFDWLEDCAEPARRLYARQERLAQEAVGWGVLRSQ